MSKPAPLAQLVKGKVVDTCLNFVNTFNWMAKWLYYLKTDNSISIKETEIDRPVIGISGFKTAKDGTVPTKSGNGIVWNVAGGPDELTVITDISFEIAGGQLKANLTKKKLKAVSYDSVSDSSVKVHDVAFRQLVWNTSYNSDGNHEFKQERINAYVFLQSSATTSESVFVTTLHA